MLWPKLLPRVMYTGKLAPPFTTPQNRDSNRHGLRPPHGSAQLVTSGMDAGRERFIFPWETGH